MPTSNPPNTSPLTLLLEPDQCWSWLQHSRTGRVIFIRDSAIEIRPVNYAAQERVISFATASSALIAAADVNESVVFEADGHDGWTAWSVIVRGHATLTTPTPASTEIRSMFAPAKTHHITITPTSITGRLFDQAQ